MAKPKQTPFWIDLNIMKSGVLVKRKEPVNRAARRAYAVRFNESRPESILEPFVYMTGQRPIKKGRAARKRAVKRVINE